VTETSDFRKAREACIQIRLHYIELDSYKENAAKALQSGEIEDTVRQKYIRTAIGQVHTDCDRSQV